MGARESSDRFCGDVNASRILLEQAGARFGSAPDTIPLGSAKRAGKTLTRGEEFDLRPRTVGWRGNLRSVRLVQNGWGSLYVPTCEGSQGSNGDYADARLLPN